jgi:uncharacterized membrane protein
MNVTTARTVLAQAHNAPAEVSREARKSLNPALHALGLPTLGAHATLRAYYRALTTAQKATLKGALGTPASAPKARKAWDCSCTSVREHIRTHKAA